MSENETFKVSDRRALKNDDEGAEEASPKEEKPRSPDSHAHQGSTDDHSKCDNTIFQDATSNQAPKGIPILALPISEIVNFFLGILIQKSWISLGMVENPETKKIDKNFAEAKLAIDLIGAISEQMVGKWGEIGYEKEIQAHLTNLRLNYAKTFPTIKT